MEFKVGEGCAKRIADRLAELEGVGDIAHSCAYGCSGRSDGSWRCSSH